MQADPRAWIEIDSAALEHNLKTIQAKHNSSKIMAVIKANAYGHGLAVAANALTAADEFAVTDFAEALSLREINCSLPITTLSGDFSASDLMSIDGQNIRPVVFNMQQIEALQQLNLKAPLHIWLKVDTGMGRLGFCTADIADMAQKIEGFSSVASISLMTHLANADDVENPASAKQIESLMALSRIYDWRDISVLNSGGICSDLDVADQVSRPGLMIYGVSPLLNGADGQSLDLRPVMTFKSRVISVNEVVAGTTIGYGSTHVTEKDTNIATISCGYADGYPRHSPSGTPVLINNHVVPLVGRVSMDLITVDVQKLPIAHGDIATLWGPQNPIEIIAKMSATVAYDLLVGVASRVHRKIIKSV